MKKVFLITLLALPAMGVFGQIQMGKALLSGTLSYAKSGDADSYEVGIGGGYFISDNAALGGSFSFGKQAEFDPDLLFYGEVETIGFSVFSRHYFGIGDESKFYFFLQPTFNFSKSKGNDLLGGGDFEFETTYLAVSPGFTFYPASKVGVEFLLNGLIYQFPVDDGDATFAIDLRPLSPTIGITFLLGN